MGQTVIEINGVRYDATTGSVITSAPIASAVVNTIKHSGHNIDGIVPSSTPAPVILQHPKVAFRPTIGRAVHDTMMVHHKHHTKSKTLMRTAVKKPGQHEATDTHSTRMSDVQRTPSYASASTSDTRLSKALNTPTHAGVARFNLAPQTKIQPSITHMPVASQAMPVPATHHQADRPLVHTQIKQGATDFINSQLAKQSNSEEPSPFKKKRLHKRVASAVKSSKLTSIAASSLAVLLLGGFIVYQNMPTISLALANRHSGIGAKLPKGIPSNFAINRSIDASKGQVTLAFSSRTDDRHFTITQQTTDMSPSQLEEVLAVSHNKSYQSYESNGIKLYITGPGSADWVDGNMRFNVSGVSGLSSEQLATIARSL